MTELGGVGLAKDDSSCIFEPLDGNGVLISNYVFERFRTFGMWEPFHFSKQVFDCDRDAMERTEFSVSLDGAFRLFCFSSSLFKQQSDECV
ncbi:hypothetical protein C474_13324 [Halogeometricum pallidum JCM 14848]|uniref:Uncharacterized protein n=1 Tax=Halogeometricum pallidum JCM 14848 TaxID=1227487 RepID=M0D3E4_HALPD|nr:hypothetical protein C474_13324 [Halogeometricum pallidum JCM 14848]